MFAKVHSRAGPGGRAVRIVAICDEELLGRVLEEGEARLDLRKYRSFYAGERVGEGEAVALIRGAENLNLVGKKALAAAGRVFAIEEASVKKVGGVPHLQVFRL